METDEAGVSSKRPPPLTALLDEAEGKARRKRVTLVSVALGAAVFGAVVLLSAMALLFAG